jgi:hypothetical protein
MRFHEEIDGCRETLNDDIVARSAIEDVEPEAADEHVIAGTTAQDVIAIAADQDVVAVAAIGGQLDGRPQPRRLDDVIAGKAVDDDSIGCL